MAAHEGQLFGWFNQFLGVVVTLGLVLMSVAGVVLWRNRKPTQALGAPAPLPMPQGYAGKAVTVITLLLALVLPLLAMSMVFIWLMERLVLRQFESTRGWLGLRSE